jgi:hypothetical protein
VACLDGQDGGCGIEEYGVVEEGRTAEVGSDTDVLYDTGGRSQGRNIDQSRVKLEVALEGRSTVVGECLLKESSVRGLVLLDCGERLRCELGGREASIGKVSVLEFCNSLGVKLGLELLQNVGELYIADGLAHETQFLLWKTNVRRGCQLPRRRESGWGGRRPKEGQPERRG